ncbi:hypothetical protein ACP70R_010683 [Stipagrostis hirtigluma subsp. patula]
MGKGAHARRPTHRERRSAGAEVARSMRRMHARLLPESHKVIIVAKEDGSTVAVAMGKALVGDITSSPDRFLTAPLTIFDGKIAFGHAKSHCFLLQ